MLRKNKNYDKKIFRLLYILNKLDRGGKVSTRGLSKEFNVSQRSVQRDLELLNMVGFPLTTSDAATHSFTEGFSLRKLMLSKEEASLLSFLYEIAKSLGRSFEESFGGIMKKVLTKESEPIFYAKVPEGVKLDKEYPFMKDLEHGIRRSLKTGVTYQSKKEEKSRVVHPYKVIFFEGFWYLLARTDQDEKIFKLGLENIRGVKVLSGHFEVPGNLKTMLDESVNIWFADQRNKRVVLKVDKEAAKFFKGKKYLPLQKVIKENKDGSLIIETKVSHNMEVVPTVFLWIPYVRVTTPKKLSRDIKGVVADYLNTL